jgi:hypothetical protein
MAVWKDGEKLGDVSADDLWRDENGNVLHAPYDIHWSVAERMYELPRELMRSKVERIGGKVVNFSSAYGATAKSLERKMEADTGVKPEEGMGEKGLDAIAARQPRATEFLQEMAEIPRKQGYYRAASGRLRHCILHGSGSGVSWRTRQSIESALGRELRNFPMQESVASTSARAGQWLRRAYRSFGMEARPVMCLYDSLVTECSLDERFAVARIHQTFMSDLNTWVYEDDRFGRRELNYEIDTDFVYRWSTKPPKEEAKKLEDPDWHPASERSRKVLEFKNLQLFV